jgi:hypothetical protein
VAIYNPSAANFQVGLLAANLDRCGRRVELTAEALADIRSLAEEQAVEATQYIGFLDELPAHTSYDPDLIFRRQHREQFALLLYGLLQALCDHAGRDLEQLMRVAPNPGDLSTDRNFERALSRKVMMYKFATIHICRTSPSP